MRQTKQNGRKRFRKKSTRRLRKKRAMKGGEGCDSVNKPRFNYFRTSEEKICHGTFVETIETFNELLISWKTETDSTNFEKNKAMLEIIRSKFTAESSNKTHGIPECFFKLIDKCIDNLITSIGNDNFDEYKTQINNAITAAKYFSQIENCYIFLSKTKTKDKKYQDILKECDDLNDNRCPSLLKELSNPKTDDTIKPSSP